MFKYMFRFNKLQKDDSFDTGIILGGDFRDFSQKNHQNLREICEMRENLARQFEPENV
jgi:hypothetical protein